MLARLKKLVPQRHPLRLLWHYLRAFLAAARYGFPARRLTMIGITGTDGKTTTVGMVARILNHAGIPTGALSTALFQIKDQITLNATQKTSPSPFLIQAFLRRLIREGCTHAVLECSSHGLVQGRLGYTWPAIAAITNTTPEHLDYHGSMEQYRMDKGMLFRMLRGRGSKVLNANDETYAMYREIRSAHTITYAGNKDNGADRNNGGETTIWSSDITVTTTGSNSIIHWENIHRPPSLFHLALSIPGLFNVENALCAIGCALACGVPLQTAMDALRDFRGVPGRMERITEGQPFAVYVDFTVTPAAYEKTLSALRAMTGTAGRILVLTGSCGDRMREKRPQIGRICSTLADVVVVTNEDPYTENPEKIIAEIWSGMDHTRVQAHRISDRREAMAFLLQQARPGDSVILCAKGSDTTMWVGTQQIPWDERAIAREILRSLRR